MGVSAAKAAKILAQRKKSRPIPIALTGDFPLQEAFIEDKARWISAQCSRRAGKTTGLAIKFYKTMEKHPESQCVYLALTRDSARDIMWPILHELNDKYNWGCDFTESRLTMTHPNGAKLSIVGADMKNFIKRLKGRKFPGVGVDEAQDFGTHLQSLVDDVLTPCTADYEDGWLAITGTPGPVPQGYFFDVTRNKRYGYSGHEWTLFDNPHMPDPVKFVEELRKKREWPENHPTLLREYKNQWVLDVQSLWIRYTESLNHFPAMPVEPGAKWNYIFGIDIGWRDADAIAVLAYKDGSKEVYLAEELITSKQGLTELVAQVQLLMAKYNPDKMMIDEGGLGKKLAEEMRRRYHIPVQAADKTRKQENVEILNDTLARGQFKAKSTSRFAKDSYLVQVDWDKSTPDKIVIKKTPHSDIIDAVLYAFKESPAYTWQAEPKKPKVGSKEWADQQANEMWDSAMNHFQDEKDRKEIMGWND